MIWGSGRAGRSRLRQESVFSLSFPPAWTSEFTPKDRKLWTSMWLQEEHGSPCVGGLQQLARVEHRSPVKVYTSFEPCRDGKRSSNPVCFLGTRPETQRSQENKAGWKVDLCCLFLRDACGDRLGNPICHHWQLGSDAQARRSWPVSRTFQKPCWTFVWAPTGEPDYFSCGKGWLWGRTSPTGLPCL